MKYIKLFASKDEANGVIVETPFVGSINGQDAPIFASEKNFGEKAELVIDEESGKVVPQKPDPYKAIDLGLSVKWANMNIGAESEEQAGLYFAWGDTEGFKESEVSGDMFSSSWYSSRPGASLTSNITADGGHDAARENMGGTWRMPTQAEITELRSYDNRTWTTVNGVNGWKIVNSSDSSKYIFLPAAGRGYSGSVYRVGSYGFCWSSAFYSSSYSCSSDFYSGYFGLGYNLRYYGFSVRGVQS